MDRLKAQFGLRIPSFGHAGDGNIHVNIMSDPQRPGEIERAQSGARCSKESSRGGAISGEHGIGFSKARFRS